MFTVAAIQSYGHFINSMSKGQNEKLAISQLRGQKLQKKFTFHSRSFRIC